MEMKRSRIVMMLRAALALGAVLSLVSCGVLNYIFGSVFPATVMLAKAQADLSGMITADEADAFRVRVVETPSGYGYVVVTGNPSSGPKAIFYDLDLNKKATFTAANGLTADGVMADVNGNIALGNYLLNPADLSQLATISAVTLGSNNTAGNDGFADSSSFVNVFSFFVGSNTLSWTTASGAWSAPTSPTPPALSVSLSGLQLFAVLDDGNSSGKVYFAVGDQSNNQAATAYFFSEPKSPFSIPTPPPYVLDTALSRDNLEPNTIGFANGSIFAYDQKAASFVKINPSDGSVEASFYSATDARDTRFAYRVKGGSFYGFDTKTRILTKYGAWW
jgi:hypothetical protein